MLSQKWINCLNCGNSYSLPAGEKFDDGSVSDNDRLICMVASDSPKVVPTDGHCIGHTLCNEIGPTL